MMPATDPVDDVLDERPLCRRCTLAVVSRPRGLCWRCFRTPGVREQFAPIGPSGRRGVGHKGARLAAFPTSAPPGSPEKLQVLEDRAAAGVALWHPEDARFEGDAMRA